MKRLEKNPCKRSDVESGFRVLYAEEPNVHESQWKRGIVADILTPEKVEFDENGIKIRLKTGHHGYTKRVLELEEFTDEEIYEMILHETKHTEKKATFKTELETGNEKKCLRDVIAREVAAMLNTEGGIIFIGVKDDGEIIGLELDLKNTIPIRKNQPLDDKLWQEMYDYISLKLNDKNLDDFWDILPMRKINGKNICIMVIQKSDRPVFVDEEIMIFDCRRQDWKKTENKFPAFYKRNPTGIAMVDIRKMLQKF